MKIILAMIILFFSFISCWPGEDNVEVRGKIETQSLTIKGNTQYPSSPTKGELFYRNDAHQLYLFDGLNWQSLAGGSGSSSLDLRVATKIIAASNTQDKSKADLACSGTKITGGDDILINIALSDLNSRGGGVLYLLEGNYWIDNAIRVPSNTAIIGTGPATVLSPRDAAPLNSSGNNKGVFTNYDTTNGNSYILVQNIKIDGNKTGNTNSQYGIYFFKVSFSSINKVWVQNMTSIGIYAPSSMIYNCDVLLNGSHGIYCSAGCSVLDSNILTNQGSGVYVSGMHNYVNGNNIKSNSTYGIYMNSADYNVLAGNNIQSNGSHGIYLYGYNTSATHNRIMNNYIDTNGGSGLCLDYNTQANIISGNYIFQNVQYGLSLDNASSYNSINGNYIVNNGGTSGTYDGIKIVSGGFQRSDYNLITSNVIQQTSGFHINLSGTMYNYMANNIASSINQTSLQNYYMSNQKISFEQAAYQNPGSNGMIIPGAFTYIPLNPSSSYLLNSTKPIEKGSVSGQILILENISSAYNITVYNSESNTQLSGGVNKIMNPGSIITLIWDFVSGDCCWVQTGGKE